MRGATEILGARPNERARNDAADAHGVHQFRCDTAEVEQAIKPEAFFVRGDLEHAVLGGVADRLAGLDMLHAEAADDGHARAMAIGEDARQMFRDRGHPIFRAGEQWFQFDAFCNRLCIDRFDTDADHGSSQPNGLCIVIRQDDTAFS